MKRSVTIVCAGAVLLFAVPAGLAAMTIVDFDAVALRPANDGVSGLPAVQENTYGPIPGGVMTGMTALTQEAGQKAFYGTKAFNGYALADISSIGFTLDDVSGSNGKLPYTNLVITDGAGNYGVISSRNRTSVGSRHTYFFGTGLTYGFNFYEPSPDGGSWAHGTEVTWSDIKDWQLLGAGDTRPLYSGEAGQARAPLEHALTLVWGDSATNYLGGREIYDVVVTLSDGKEYIAGQAIPVPGSVLLGVIGLTLAFRRHRA